jgi:curved DNA binding protein
MSNSNNLDKQTLPVYEQIDQSHTSNYDKYRVAGEICNLVLDNLIGLMKPGANVFDLCVLGDKMITDETSKKYKKGLIHGKGIAFPTCISLNECAGYYSPISDEGVFIKEGDLVKIELGVQIDGFPTVLAHTILVTDNPDDPKYARQMNLLMALDEINIKIPKKLKVGKTNLDVSGSMLKVAEKYNLNMLIADASHVHAPGILSNQISQNIYDGDNDDGDEEPHTLIMPRKNESYDYEIRSTEIEEDEVFAIDVVFSTGSGKVDSKKTKTSIYKRNHNMQYNLKMKSSRYTLTHFRDNYFPMNLRALQDKKARMGVFECLKHFLLEPYPTLYEKDGEFVGQTKMTLAVRKKKTNVLAGRQFDLKRSETTNKQPEESK